MREEIELPAALTHYARAVTALLDPTPDHPSGRYSALVDAMPGRQGSGGHHARSMPPLWIDATQLLGQIDATALRWHRDTKTAQKSLRNTPRRLESLSDAHWRPQDAPKINDMANTITRWALDIDTLTLTNETHRWELTAACPECGIRITHRKDSAGEHTRQAALQVTANTCICTNCRTTWPRERFELLARVIGCNQLP